VTYSISINGHKQTSGEEESRAFEHEIAEAAAEFVSALEGVTAASFSGGTVGTRDLLAPAAAEEA